MYLKACCVSVFLCVYTSINKSTIWHRQDSSEVEVFYLCYSKECKGFVFGYWC